MPATHSASGISSTSATGRKTKCLGTATLVHPGTTSYKLYMDCVLAIRATNMFGVHVPLIYCKIWSPIYMA